jgi:subtilase family serine protease
MKINSHIVRNLTLSVAVAILFPGAHASAQTASQSVAAASQAPFVPARITQAIDETQLVRLKGNVHPLARPKFDRGIVPDGTPMQRMMFVLQRSPEQEAALRQLMDEQLSKDSLNYHKWLTPQQFGQQFGPADSDIQTITDWLTRQGFQQVKVAAGRAAIEFSGNVSQVRNAFHTEIHQFNVDGKVRQANVNDPQIPAALSPVVAGIVSLHNFPRHSYKHDAGIHIATRNTPGSPEFTTTSGCGTNNASPCYILGPADFAKVYNIPAGLDGTNEQIALVADSNINPQDVADFQNLFGLASNPPNIILNGPDPGLNSDEGEADLDVQVSGMVAPKATIDLVVSEGTLTAAGIDLSAFFIVDNNIAPVMSVSFGACEANLGTAGNAFYNALWEQAAAQGITVTISAGDPGSAGCDDFTTETAATLGLAVSGFASTPFNVAVGGTDFDDAGTQTNFWSSTNGTGRESALGYIHEIPWNNSCATTATSSTLNTVCPSTNTTLNNIVGGAGGPSGINAGTFVGYPKPAWQSGIIPLGIAAGDNHRYIPDVSLFASNGPQSQSFYLICQADAVPPGNPPSCATSGSFSFGGAGGTSASSPAFAAIMALINQNNGRQGNPNPTLYKIAATSGQSCNSSTELLTGSTCSFNDVTKGNNSVPCVGNSPNCSSTTNGVTGVLISPAATTTPAWTTAAGYDLATGLGSVNVANLNTQWPIATGTFHGTTTALTINGGTSTVTITHGTQVTAAVTVTSSSGTPTGDVSLLAPTTVNGGIGSQTLASGSATIKTTSLPGGSYSVTARYAGDTAFSSSSSTGVPVVVNKEDSGLLYGIVTFDPISGAIVSTNATSFTYGSPYILRMDILNHTGTSTNCQPLVTGGTETGCALDATGAVTIMDSINGAAPVPLDTGTFVINSAGHAEDQPIQLTGGTHALSATYSGDISYNPVTTAVLDTVTVSKAATQVPAVMAAPATGVTTATPVTLTATIVSNSNSVTGTTGTVTFFNGGVQLGSPAAVTPVAATGTSGAGGTAALTTTFTTVGTESITAQYNGDTNYAASAVSTPITVTVTQAQVGNFTVSESAVTLSSSAGAGVNSTVTVTPSGGFTGTVAVTPATTTPGVTCTPSPLNISVTSASAATGQLSCSVLATSTALTASNIPQTQMLEAKTTTPSAGGNGWWALSAGTGFAALFLLFLPGGRKRYRAALGLGLVCILSFTFGCGGGYGGGGGGLTATVTKLTVPSAKVASGTAFAFSVTVTGGTPAGQVVLFDNGTMIGTAATVSGGTATPTAPALAVGTHVITAHYQGDASTMPSASGAINMTVTGTTSVAITTSPVASPAAPALSVTIN